jgi:SEC-C motif-containing protein
MTTVPSKFTPAYYEPGRNKSCVCGSGMKFKKCCAGTYSSEAYELFKDAFNKGDYEAALT